MNEGGRGRPVSRTCHMIEWSVRMRGKKESEERKGGEMGGEEGDGDRGRRGWKRKEEER